MLTIIAICNLAVITFALEQFAPNNNQIIGIVSLVALFTTDWILIYLMIIKPMVVKNERKERKMWAPLGVLLLIVVLIIDLSVASFAMEQLSAPSDIQVVIGIASFAILVAANYIILHNVVIRPLTRRRKEGNAAS